MKKLEFTPQQMRSWSRRIDVDDIYACMAIHANEIFNEWYASEIESAPVVYGRVGSPTEFAFSKSRMVDDTHQAKLICVEEI